MKRRNKWCSLVKWVENRETISKSKKQKGRGEMEILE